MDTSINSFWNINAQNVKNQVGKQNGVITGALMLNFFDCKLFIKKQINE